MEHVDFEYTAGMSEEEITEYLQTHEVGVLSLARDGDAYAIPISYHYDDERLLLRLTDDGHSEKMEYLDETGEACFLLYDDVGSWSIVAVGTLRQVDSNDGQGFDDEAINELFDQVRIFDQAVDEVVVHVYEFEMDAVTGRRSAEEDVDPQK